MLSRTLLHIYGPFCIYSWGMMIALGCFITYYLIKRNPKRKSIISEAVLTDVFSLSILASVIGGRILHTVGSADRLASWFDLCALHEGGFSILGAIIGFLLIIPWYLRRQNIPVLQFLDLIACYAPLLQAISRIGCYFAGCCFGTTTTLPWAIMYVTHDTLAPRFCAMHPTQLYASAALMALFLFLSYGAKRWQTIPGQLTALYLMGIGAIRFTIDYWRADREFFSWPTSHIFSMHQWIALVILIAAGIGFSIISSKKHTRS